MSLLAYIALVYAFLADVFLFDHQFTMLELFGAAIITFFNLLTIILKATGKFDLEDKEDDPDVTSSNYDRMIEMP